MNLHIYMYIYIHIYMFVYIYIYIYIIVTIQGILCTRLFLPQPVYKNFIFLCFVNFSNLKCKYFFFYNYRLTNGWLL